MNKTIFLLIFFILSAKVSAQSVNAFMQEVLKHHPGIVSGRELLTSRKAESKTGLTPADPNINVGYFPGIPESIGDKITWSVSQSIDFPSLYKNIKLKKENDYQQAIMEYRLAVLILLEEAREKAIMLIALQENINKTKKRIEHLNRLEEAYSKMLEEGEATIIEYNKIGLGLAVKKNMLMEYESERQTIKSYLDLISSNNSEIIERSAYPLFDEPEFLDLLEEKREMHPAFMIPEKEIVIAESNIKLAKARKLPAFEIGFASEIIAENQFTGPTIGLSIPLWKNKGRVEEARAKKSLYEVQYESQIRLLENNLENKYNQYLSVKESLRILKRSLTEYITSDLLLKALQEGEISIIEYFTELSAYYDIEDKIIEKEKEYYKLCSQLYDHFPDLNFQEN